MQVYHPTQRPISGPPGSPARQAATSASPELREAHFGALGARNSPMCALGH